MSYILDALKRADAERQRGAAPGLHAQHSLPTSASTGKNSRLWWLLAGVLTLGLGTGVAWLWQAGTPVATPAPQNLPHVVAPAPELIAPTMTPPAQVAAAATAPAAAQTAPAPAPVPQIAPLPQHVVKSVPAGTKPPAPERKTETPPPNVPLLSDLPEDTRRQIPKISITGSVYATTPAQRLLLANNLVLNQGSVVAVDLTLEEIGPKSSIFNFKGTRFRLMH